MYWPFLWTAKLEKWRFCKRQVKTMPISTMPTELFSVCVKSGRTLFSATSRVANPRACLQSSSSGSAWKVFSILTVMRDGLFEGIATVSLASWNQSMQSSTGRGNHHWTVCESHGTRHSFEAVSSSTQNVKTLLKLESNPQSWLALEGMV